MALSFGNRRRNLTTNAWSTQRQQLLVRKQHSFIETGSSSSSNSNSNCALSLANKGRGNLTRGLSVGRSYDGIRHKLNATPTTTNSRTTTHVGNHHLQFHRQATLEQDYKLRTAAKPKETPAFKNPRISYLNSNATRLNLTRRETYTGANNGNENGKFKERTIVAWSSTNSLVRSVDDDLGINTKKKLHNNSIGDIADNKTRKASITSNASQQRKHSIPKVEANKINLSIVLPQAVKISLDNETAISDIDSSLDSGVDTDTASSQPSRSTLKTKTSQDSPKQTTLSPKNLNQPNTSLTNTAAFKRAQFRGSRIDTISSNPSSNNVTATPSTTISSTQSSVTTVISASTVANSSTTNFSASPSLIVQRRPPLVRAMSAPVRPLDDSSKGAFAANKRKPRRRRIITRNISCDKTTEQEFLTEEIINGKKVLTRSRSVVASDVITLVSLMSSEGSDSEKEDLSSGPTTASTIKSESSPTRRAPSLRKTGKSVSFQENYPPNFQLASKEYSHMIRRGSIAPLTARLRPNRPPTAPASSIFLNMSTNNTETAIIKDRDNNAETNNNKADNNESGTTSATTNANTEQGTEYVFPDYVRSIKERECWKLFQKMCNKGVNVSYDTILRGMLTPTEFRQIQKQRELEEAKARDALEAENEGENVKPPTQTAIDRLSEALLKK